MGRIAIDLDHLVVLTLGMQPGHARHDGVADRAADNHDAAGNQDREREVAVFREWQNTGEHQLVDLRDQYPER
ncbi:hypothetical protein D3C80_1917830 [compost metagenome]